MLNEEQAEVLRVMFADMLVDGLAQEQATVELLLVALVAEHEQG